ncbi:MAG: hypothetical protein LUG91_07910 [Ruminococcus sp.]|nr:hypothetical protein [Ruminococcus sp.]
MKKNKTQRRLPKSNNKIIMRILKVILVLLTLAFPLAMVIPAGVGLIWNGDSYGSDLMRTGVLLVVSGAAMIVGTILVCVRKNIASLICTCVGFGVCMLMLKLLTDHADSAGWSDPYTMEPVSDMYIARIIPTIAPFALTVVIALIQFFSYEAVQARREKKRLKEEEENAPAPPII